MTREEMKDFLPILQAWAEGKTIQCNFGDGWIDADIDLDLSLGDISKYRIKPEPKYRPFKNDAECWEEMKKHSNFGWVIRSGVFLMVQSIYLDAIHTIEDKHGIGFENAFTELTFTDGAPFGIKEG